MRMTFRRSAFVTTALVCLTAMTAAAAPPGANDPTAATPPAVATPAPPDTQQSVEARVDQRIKDLHAKLQITAEQEPEWQKFVQTMRANARKMDQAFESRVSQMEGMNAMDNMQSYARITQQHAQDVQALLPPFKALYGKMSESQKQTADQVFREDANRGDQANHG